MAKVMASGEGRGRAERARLAVAAVAGPMLLLACNMITGADDLAIGDGDDEGGAVATGGSGLTGSSGQGGNQVGGGGASSSTSSGTGASSSTSSGTGGTSSGSSSSSSSGSSSGTGAGPTGCDYPPGPYGVTVGATVSPSLSWQGYAEGPPGSVATITMSEYFDCDGTKGINALMVDTSQYG